MIHSVSRGRQGVVFGGADAARATKNHYLLRTTHSVDLFRKGIVDLGNDFVAARLVRSHKISTYYQPFMH